MTSLVVSVLFTHTFYAGKDTAILGTYSLDQAV